MFWWYPINVFKPHSGSREDELFSFWSFPRSKLYFFAIDTKKLWLEFKFSSLFSLLLFYTTAGCSIYLGRLFDHFYSKSLLIPLFLLALFLFGKKMVKKQSVGCSICSLHRERFESSGMKWSLRWEIIPRRRRHLDDFRDFCLPLRPAEFCWKVPHAHSFYFSPSFILHRFAEHLRPFPVSPRFIFRELESAAVWSQTSRLHFQYCDENNTRILISRPFVSITFHRC